MDDITRDKKLQGLRDWLQVGIDNNFCTPPVCDTHDGAPRTEEEENEFEEGGDPCITVVRINTELLGERLIVTTERSLQDCMREALREAMGGAKLCDCNKTVSSIRLPDA